MPRMIAIILVFLIALIPCSVQAQSVSFDDLNGHWGEKEILELARKGIAKGADGNHFLPNEPMTRAQFVAMLHRALGISIKHVTAPNIRKYFTDVQNDDFYANYLYDLASLGIVSERGTFRGDDPLTREEAAQLLVNGYIYKKNLASSNVKGSPIPYADQNEIAPMYRKAVQYAVKLNLLEGFPDDTFKPKRSLTRAQGAMAIYRLLQVTNDPDNEPSFSFRELDVKSGAALNMVYEAEKTDSGLKITFSYQVPSPAHAGKIVSLAKDRGTLVIVLEIVKRSDEAAASVVTVEQRRIHVGTTDINLIKILDTNGNLIKSFPYPSFIKNLR
ncbi:hypothetical protein BSNK01_27740 [Bacillaceae bacterium]